VLEELSKASNVTELQDRIPGIVKLFTRYADEILSGRCDARKLIFNARVTRKLDEYRVFNNQLAALIQLNDEGIEVHPGESISYMIMNSYTHDPYKRVKLADRVEEDDGYDRRKHLEFLCRFGDSMLRPFGLTEDVLAEHASKIRQTALEKYGKVLV
jgi:DNA polymerase elongation subunit (family B)